MRVSRRVEAAWVLRVLAASPEGQGGQDGAEWRGGGACRGPVDDWQSVAVSCRGSMGEDWNSSSRRGLHTPSDALEGRGGGNPHPPLPGRAAYAQPLSPKHQVPASMAFVTDSNRPQPLW